MKLPSSNAASNVSHLCLSSDSSKFGSLITENPRVKQHTIENTLADCRFCKAELTETAGKTLNFYHLKIRGRLFSGLGLVPVSTHSGLGQVLVRAVRTTKLLLTTLWLSRSGIQSDDHLKWTAQVEYLCAELAQRLHCLCRLRLFGVDSEIMITFYNAVVKRLIRYSMAARFGNPSVQLKSKLNSTVKITMNVIGKKNNPPLNTIY